MKAAKQVEVEVQRISHDGRGIGALEGKTLFVDGALAGETVVAEVRRKRRRLLEANTLEVITSAPERVTPRCDHAAICGGCSLQHMNPDAQVELKQNALMEQLKHFGGVEPQQVLPPMRGPEYGYRRKARLGVRYVVKRDEVLVGFREKKNSFIADIEQCPVLDARVGQLLMALRALIKSLEAYRHVPQIEVAVGDDANETETGVDSVALVLRHLQPLSEADTTALASFAQEKNIALYLQPAGPNSVYKIWPETELERLSYRLPDFDLEMLFHPMDFTQVNADINRQVVNRAYELLDPQPGERILDLFCGLGNFSLPLATSGAQVVAVEGSEAMVKRGYENARHNGLSNVDFYAADLAQDFSAQPWAQEGFDKLLIDPPRSGALEVVRYLAAFNARRIVYVSCNPATLARDTGELVQQGYRLVAAGALDMFPHTAHVESIALFEK